MANSVKLGKLIKTEIDVEDIDSGDQNSMDDDSE